MKLVRTTMYDLSGVYLLGKPARADDGRSATFRVVILASTSWPCLPPRSIASAAMSASSVADGHSTAGPQQLSLFYDLRVTP